MDAIITHPQGGFTVTGNAVGIMRAATVRAALRMHVNTQGAMRLCRGASPTAMIATAKQITGIEIKARDYAGAIVALDHWITEAKCKVMHIASEV